ncbi:hypothetical protein BBOH_0560 [Bifidobacterium bohemicum DSM 22767]|uniref:Uncharacterized protein n=1 Tax=Bifidobacterium bohemicum DSM 22767 TaxID=1437606 RepID=A0A086ZGV8_9BIFI|nr:hypothetical protein BBOH_0560 [Bifidobacterium bohemicum DSM 22767]
MGFAAGGVTRAGYRLAGWSLASDGSSKVYAPGSTWNLEAVDVPKADDVTWYAVWKPLPVPVVSSVVPVVDGDGRTTGVKVSGSVSSGGGDLASLTVGGADGDKVAVTPERSNVVVRAVVPVGIALDSGSCTPCSCTRWCRCRRLYLTIQQVPVSSTGSRRGRRPRPTGIWRCRLRTRPG